MATKIKFKRKLSGSQTSVANMALDAGEPLFDTTTNTLYVGSGVNTDKTVNVTGSARSIDLANGAHVTLNNPMSAAQVQFGSRTGDGEIVRYIFAKTLGGDRAPVTTGELNVTSIKPSANGTGYIGEDGNKFANIYSTEANINTVYATSIGSKDSGGKVTRVSTVYAQSVDASDGFSGNLNGTATNATNLMISGKAYAATVSGSTLTLTPVTTTTQ